MPGAGRTIKANNLDPDEGNSKLCSACKLPIFATPFTITGESVLHDQCVNLPKEWKDCDFHPGKPMLLHDNMNSSSTVTCSQCSQKCGNKVYYCQDPDCGMVLDVACALPIKILHRSHHHRLIAVRGQSLSPCGACGATHTTGSSSSCSYICVACGFWIHPKCAALPNVIYHQKHEHPLVLFYDVQRALTGLRLAHTYESSFVDALRFLYKSLLPDPDIPRHVHNHSCALCWLELSPKFGIYSCINCPKYFVHIHCATSDRRTFRPVLIGKARFAGLVRLPIPDEHQSYIEHIRENLTTKSDDSLILHREDIKDENSWPRVCDACLKVINKPPFYSSPSCSNFFLHDYCLCIPNAISPHPFLTAKGITESTRNSITLQRNTWSYRTIIRLCDHCGCPSGRVFYTNILSHDVLDVSCALMSPNVTHEAHNTAHFLRLSDIRGRGCNCCGQSLVGLGYECTTCSGFTIHTWCAMLPATVTHKFDPHPLRLITTTTTTTHSICEICESEMNNKVWHYGCEECDQWFHIDCIPCLDWAYKFKSGEDVRGKNMRLIRGLTLQSQNDYYCTDVTDEYDILQSESD